MGRVSDLLPWMRPCCAAAWVCLAAGASLVGCGSGEPDYATTIEPTRRVLASGRQVAYAVAQFRQDIGSPSAPPVPDPVGSTGPASGRQAASPTTGREIHWDEVPPSLRNEPRIPSDFYHSADAGGEQPQGAPQGLVLETTDAAGLQVSDSGFSDIEPSYRSQLPAFSTPNLFSPVGSNLLTLSFGKPGAPAQPAAITRIGVVFVDVDRPDVTQLWAYDGDRLLWTDMAPPRPSELPEDAFSFVALDFSGRASLTRLVLRLGDAALGRGVLDRTSGGAADIVVIDNVLYDEPQPMDAVVTTTDGG